MRPAATQSILTLKLKTVPKRLLRLKAKMMMRMYSWKTIKMLKLISKMTLPHSNIS